LSDLATLLRQVGKAFRKREIASPPVLLPWTEDFIHRVLRDPLTAPEVLRVVVDTRGRGSGVNASSVADQAKPAVEHNAESGDSPGALTDECGNSRFAQPRLIFLRRLRDHRRHRRRSR